MRPGGCMTHLQIIRMPSNINWHSLAIQPGNEWSLYRYIAIPIYSYIIYNYYTIYYIYILYNTYNLIYIYIYYYIDGWFVPLLEVMKIPIYGMFPCHLWNPIPRSSYTFEGQKIRRLEGKVQGLPWLSPSDLWGNRPSMTIPYGIYSIH